MSIIHLHTPSGIVKVNTETITDNELAQLDLTRADLERILYPLSIDPSPDYLRACEILSESPPAITMVEIWEFMRITGKRLGYRFD